MSDAADRRAWLPRVTVAAVAERDGRFLLVEEMSRARVVLNQPAGHWEEGETLTDAVVREVREETAWHFVPEHVVGLYHWRNQHNGNTHLRVTFCGSVATHQPDQPLDEGILATRWMTYAELAGDRARHRSPMVLRCIDDYLRGQRFALALLQEIA